MIAFHYPPYAGGSGVHRTLKFSRYLPDYGWEPLILSADPRAYPQVGYDQVKEIPGTLFVKRAFALDTARHLSVRGFHFRWMSLPDRWASWWFGAVVAGLRAVRRYRPVALWSTYPIATAHLIGLTLHRLTGLPWVADFRDSMTEENYPRDFWSRQCYRWIERKVVQYSSCLFFTAASARRMYLDRYPDLCPERAFCIPNGYDEEDFDEIRDSIRPADPEERPIRLLHAGLIYTDERDPTKFFAALSNLKQRQRINSKIVRIDLRASGSENYYAEMISRFRIADIVRLLPALPYRQALQDCADSDGLLLFQAASCNHQIPAKVYEYLRLRKPILALTPRDGDTAALLIDSGGATIVDLADEETIMSSLPHFIESVRSGTHPLPNMDCTQRYSRMRQAAALACHLDKLNTPGTT